MKKLLSICAAALFALVLVGCNNNDVEGDGSGDKTSKLTKIRISLPVNASRVGYDENENGLKVTWKKGYKIGVYNVGGDDAEPDMFTLVGDGGEETGVFEGEFTKEYDDYFDVAYPYTPNKSINDLKAEIPAKLKDCQMGNLEHLEDYDVISGEYYYDEEDPKACTNTLYHSIAVVKLTTPAPTSTQTKVGVRGAWQPGFTYWANNNGSNTTYIAVPESWNAPEELYVALYDETNKKCSQYKKTSAVQGGKRIEVGYMARVHVGSETPYTYDCDGLIENHEYVNMGNGVGMATMNIGANSPTGYGYYFRFGEQKGWDVRSDAFKVVLSTSLCVQYDKDGKTTGCETYNNAKTFYDKEKGQTGFWGLIDQNITSFQGLINQEVNNTTYGDAARYNWGGNWMMINSDLVGDNKWTATEITTAPQGYNLTSTNGKTTFLPAACHCVSNWRQGEYGGTSGTDPHYCGHYWSTLPGTDHTGYYWNFIIPRVRFEWTTTGTDETVQTTGGRHGGFSVRPIISLSSTSN